MVKEFYKEAEYKEEEDTVKLTYYLLTDSISEEFCDLKVYGIEIEKMVSRERIRAWHERKIIPDLFFDKEEAKFFLDDITQKRIEPIELKNCVQEYIGKHLQTQTVESV